MRTYWYLFMRQISEIFNKSTIGLYRDDGLSFFRNKSGTQLDKIKKKLQTLRTLLGNNGKK